jgi:isocitrate dehydrogenase (NAD+)
MQNVVVLEGDGIGPEIVSATRRVLDAMGAELEYDVQPAGEAAAAEFGTPMPEATIAAIREAGVALKGPLTTGVAKGYRSLNVMLRQELGLYANVRPARTLPGVTGPLAGNPDINLVIVRENTEDLYIGRERTEGDTAIAEKVITKSASRRAAIFAFELAKQHGYTRVTTVHKANILKETDGLFLRESQRVAERYPDITHDDLIADNAAQWLVRDPASFGVLLCPNFLGDLFSDLTATLVWNGIGLGPSGQYGKDAAVFEAIHGTAPAIAGKNLANPTALMLSAVMLLEHIGQRDAAERMRSAIERVYAETDIRTGDLGGNATTSDFADAVIRMRE